MKWRSRNIGNPSAPSVASLIRIPLPDRTLESLIPIGSTDRGDLWLEGHAGLPKGEASGDLDRSLEFMHFCGSANLKWNGI
jgi:hypothetical protein